MKRNYAAMVASREEVYEKSVVAFKNDINAIKDQIMSLKAENAQYEWETLQIADEVNILREENGKLSNSLQEITNNISSLKEEKEDIQRKLQEYEEKECISKSKIAGHLEEDLKNLKEENCALKKHIESREYELKQLDQNLYVALQDNKTLKETCDFYKTEFERKNKECENISNDKKSEEANLKRIIASITADRTNLEKKVNEMEEVIRASGINIKNQTDKMAELTAKNQQYEVNTKKYKSLWLKTRDLNTLKETKLKEMDDRNSALLAELEKTLAVQEELNELKKKYEQAVESNKILVEDLNVCHLQVNKISSDYDKVLSDLRKMTEVESTLNKSINDLESTNRQLEEASKKDESDYERMTKLSQAIIHKLDKMLQTSRCELSEQRHEISILKQDNLEQEFKIQELKRDLREKNVTLADMTKSI